MDEEAPQCFITYSRSTAEDVLEAVRRAVRSSGFSLVDWVDFGRQRDGGQLLDIIESAIRRASAVVAVVDRRGDVANGNLLYELGFARAAKQPANVVHVLAPGLSTDQLPSDLRGLLWCADTGDLGALERAVTERLRARYERIVQARRELEHATAFRRDIAFLRPWVHVADLKSAFEVRAPEDMPGLARAARLRRWTVEALRRSTDAATALAMRKDLSGSLAACVTSTPDAVLRRSEAAARAVGRVLAAREGLGVTLGVLLAALVAAVLDAGMQVIGAATLSAPDGRFRWSCVAACLSGVALAHVVPSVVAVGAVVVAGWAGIHAWLGTSLLDVGGVTADPYVVPWALATIASTTILVRSPRPGSECIEGAVRWADGAVSPWTRGVGASLGRTLIVALVAASGAVAVRVGSERAAVDAPESLLRALGAWDGADLSAAAVGAAPALVFIGLAAWLTRIQPWILDPRYVPQPPNQRPPQRRRDAPRRGGRRA